MGCVNSKADDKPDSAGGGVRYTPPETVTTPSQLPSHQQVSQQSSLPPHRSSIASGGLGSQNGSIGYNNPLPSVPSPVPEADGSLFIARYAYQARTSEDLSFEKGETLKVHLRWEFSAEV